VGDALSRVAMFAGLSDEMRAELVSRGTPVFVRAGSWLFREGEPGHSLYVLITGRLEVMVEGPEPAVIRVLGRGDVLGELALLTESPRSASVRAIRDSELLKLEREDFHSLLESEPVFVRALTRSLGEQLRDSRGRSIDTPPIPASIAIVPLHGGLPTRALAEQIVAEIGRWRSVSQFDRPAGPEPPRELLASMLDNHERQAEQVVMVAEQPGVAEPWTEFCLHQADRVLALTSERMPPGWKPLDSTLTGCDVVYCSQATHNVETIAWHEALIPRATHLLSLDGRFQAGARRIGRRLTGRSVGVVLSGGGARGLAHVGVLEELVAAGVQIDRVAGTSMGSFIGAQFASDGGAARIRDRCEEELVLRNPWSDYTIPLVAATRGRRLREMLARVFGARQIQDLQLPYFCVSADLIMSELFVHDRGPVAVGVAASMCIPGGAPPLLMERRVLVDGGLFDNLPVETMSSFGEGPIIAVDVTAQYSPPTPSIGGRPRIRRLRAAARAAIVGDTAIRPGLHETMFRSIVLGSRDTTEEAKRHADLVINPETSSIALLAFKELDRACELGREAARSALESSPEFFSGLAR
jgi:predicted acylesterase/phospholipase RssA/CRP-like cAMP-binding protein